MNINKKFTNSVVACVLWAGCGMAMGPYEGQECNSGDKQQKVYEFFYSIEEFIENI